MKYLIRLTGWIFLVIPGLAFAQRTVGVLSHALTGVYPGYNLIYPHNQPNVYLLDNCGRIVHIWEDSANWRPGNTAYLLENSTLLKTKRDAVVAGNPIWAGGGGAIVELRDWDNTLLWSFEMNNDSMRLHHDIEPMPNGNILMIAWEKINRADAIQAGRDTTLLPDGEVWPDVILEVKPIFPDSFEIVWEWHVWDHLVQDFDTTKDNYGVLSEHPERINVNFTTNNGRADWLHSNAIDYLEASDQVMLCTPFLSEIWIIDHSTSTEQAAGSTGGFSGRGGDLMYRWGNPTVYQDTPVFAQTLFFPHDAHWAEDFLEFVNPDYGKVIVFNNRAGADFSTVSVFDPFFDMYEWAYPMLQNGLWGPEVAEQTITHPDPQAMYSTGLSSAQLLPNGNLLICSGRQGYTIELTPDDEIVWEYVTPLRGGIPVSQGESLELNDNLTFRLKRYPADYKAFEGRDLPPLGYIEMQPDTAFCDMILTSVDDPAQQRFRIYPNPADDFLLVEWASPESIPIEILDTRGVIRFRKSVMGGRAYLPLTTLPDGMYFVRAGEAFATKLVIQRWR